MVLKDFDKGQVVVKNSGIRACQYSRYHGLSFYERYYTLEVART